MRTRGSGKRRAAAAVLVHFCERCSAEVERAEPEWVFSVSGEDGTEHCMALCDGCAHDVIEALFANDDEG